MSNKKRSNTDLIAQALEINPLGRSEAQPPAPIIIEPRADPQTKLEEDFEFARENLINLIKTGADGLALLKQIAESTEHPRSFEVLATLISTLRDVNIDLVDLHKTRQDMNLAAEDTGPEKVTNNLFVGTTEDALAMLKRRRENGY